MAMTSKPRVVVLAALPALGFDLLRVRFDVAARGPRADSGWLREHAPGAAAIVADPSIPVGPELMDAAGYELAWVNLRRTRSSREWLGGSFLARPILHTTERAPWSEVLDALFFIRVQQPSRRVPGVM